MRGDPTLRSWLHRAAGCALALMLAGCLQPPPRPAASAPVAAVAPLAAGMARIWFYRDFEPSVSLNLAAVSLNGALAGYAQPDGSVFYRDVPAGHYHITVASVGTDFNQAKDVDLAPGQEAYAKILGEDAWQSTGGDTSSFHRDTFYVSLVPPQIARVELAAHPLGGG